MKIKNTFYVTNRRDWRKWLAKNHKNQKEIWLIYYRKGTGKPRISYDDAVLEALCYGWIDSTVKKIDGERFAQRFSPRRPTSILSQMNKERIRELIKEKKMTKWGFGAIAHVFNPKKDKAEKLIVPPDILEALQANKDAWKYFQKMPLPYRRIRIVYIEDRKRHSIDAYKKSLAYFLKNDSQEQAYWICTRKKGLNLDHRRWEPGFKEVSRF